MYQKRSYPKRSYAKSRPVIATQSQVRSIVKKEINKEVEKKYYYDSGSGTLTWAGTLTNLTASMATGVLSYQRIGNKIMPKSMQVRFRVDSLGTGPNVVRFILLQWFNSTTPTGDDILEVTGTSEAPLSSSQNENKRNMKILHDELISCNPQISAIANVSCGKVYVAGNRLRAITYLEGSSTVLKGAVYALFITDVTASGPTHQISSQLTYADI